MEANSQVHGENLKLLKEIYNLKTKLDDLYIQSGPNSSDYINLSMKLNLLEKEYMEEKLLMYEELVDTKKVQERKVVKAMEKYHGNENKSERQQQSLVWHVLVKR